MLKRFNCKQNKLKENVKMKKSFVSLMIGLLMIGVYGNVWAGNVVAADLDCTNPAGCVQTNEISAGAVTNGKIADRAVTDTKILDGSVSTSKIVDGAISTGKISNGAVTTDKLADWSVNGTKIVDYSVTDTKIANGAVTGSKIADGAVTDAKITGPISGSKLGSHTHNGSDIDDGSVTASKIGDGAVTDTKITGPISASKIEKPANVIVVAQVGGDFTSIQAAIDSINPTADNPYLIKVMPGTYTENITMKSYVHLQGAGSKVTAIKVPLCEWCAGIAANYKTNVEISDFTIDGVTQPGYGINFLGVSNGIIRNNTIINNIQGISIANSDLIIKNNLIRDNVVGIQVAGWVPVTIMGNIITGNDSQGINVVGGSTIIKDNVIEGGNYTGISILNDLGRISRILNNSIVNSINCDIAVQDSHPFVNFNEFNTACVFSGSWTGSYNVKFDGTPW